MNTWNDENCNKDFEWNVFMWIRSGKESYLSKWFPLLPSWSTKGATTSESSIQGRLLQWFGELLVTKVNWKSNLLLLEKLNGKKYVETIDEQVNACARRIAGNKYIFQNDNAKAVRQYFANKWIRDLLIINQVSEYYRKLVGGIWLELYTRMEDNW